MNENVGKAEDGKHEWKHQQSWPACYPSLHCLDTTPVDTYHKHQLVERDMHKVLRIIMMGQKYKLSWYMGQIWKVLRIIMKGRI